MTENVQNMTIEDSTEIGPQRATGGERIIAALLGAFIWAIIGGLALFVFAYARDDSWYPYDWSDIRATGWFGLQVGAVVGLLIGLLGGMARVVATFVQTFMGVFIGAGLGIFVVTCFSLAFTVVGLREGYLNSLMNGLIVGALYGGSVGAIFVALAGVVGGTIAGMIIGVTLSILGGDGKGVIESIRDGVQEMRSGQESEA
ncbi:MAG: hypothetical protein AAF485_12195 [Chloroflexota bacterium]